MKILSLLSWIVNVVAVFTLPFEKRSLLKRKSEGATDVGCMHMDSFAGEYTFTGDGTGSTCGLYLIASPQELVEIEFTEFDVDCENGGLVAVVDGWEMNGQYFPVPEDHALSLTQRYHTFCGPERPNKVYLSSQNVAVIQSRIVKKGQGYRVKVNFIPNPQPCNVISMFQQGVYTVKNFGERRNCSVSIIYPEEVRLLAVDVGVTEEKPSLEGATGLTSECFRGRRSDYVEIMGTDQFYFDSMNRRSHVCGLESMIEDVGILMSKPGVINMCKNTVVRLVSSGEYYNTVTFLYTPPALDVATEESADYC